MGVGRWRPAAAVAGALRRAVTARPVAARAGLVATLLAVLAVVAPLVAPTAARAALRLPPVDFPDPDVITVGATYWAYSTGSAGRNLQVISSDQLLAGASPADPLPVLPPWAVPGLTWAPGVVQLASGFTMYYVAHEAASGNQCIGLATSPTPQGPFADHAAAPFLCQESDGGSIDPHPFVAPDGHLYLLWKSDDNSRGSSPTIWSQPLSPDGRTLLGSPVRLLSDTAAWEFPVIERPAMVALDGRYYVFFAANRYDTPQSGIGYAVCTSPLGPCVDRSPAVPFVGTKGAVVGPSGPSPFRSAGGAALLGFAAWAGGVGYGNGGARSLWVGTLGFAPAYRLVARDGGVFTYGTASFLGAAAAAHPVAPIVGIAVTPDGDGYWQAAADGGVFASGSAAFAESAAGLRLAAPVTAVMAGPTGGYALVARDGGVFAFGGFAFAGSDAGRRGAAVVAAATSPFLDGPGYWLARADGTVDAFGAAPALGRARPGAPVVAIASDPSGVGYWLLAADGTVSAFGSAHAYGSVPAGPHAAAVALVPSPSGGGYWVVTADGGVFTFGDAPFAGSRAGPGAAVTAAAGAPAPLQCMC
ncbi:MAG TPA: glycoside hydrolase family 43 protein [Acidimicrobiales bacterium]|nr:glycoside hydrolase family 43 protein [Acidimicrobiales bacterium]